MNVKRISFLVLIFACLSFQLENPNTDFVKKYFKIAKYHLENMLLEAGNSVNAFPRTANQNWQLKTTSPHEWTSGFFAGNLWNLFEYSKDDSIKQAAIKWTEKLDAIQFFTGNHDLGFMMYCSYGNAYRLTGNKKYIPILVQSAKSLSSRFNAVTGCIKSWNSFKSWHGDNTYEFPVIIDNMMNLELLFFASKITGDPEYKNIAIIHAKNTMKNQIRKDYGSFHVVCYDTTTGNFIKGETAQGYSDNSTWSRGQAWGIYGFTMTYRETKDPDFLKTAEGMADFFINHKNLPKDKIPYWDFNVGEQGYAPGVKSNANSITTKYRDASAAAITASALLELSTYTTVNNKKYKKVALQILKSLSSSEYLAPVNSNANFILKHSVGSIAGNFEVNVPLVYADYYYLEALNRYNRLLSKKKIVD